MLPLDRIPAVKRVGTSTLQVFALEISDDFSSADAENMLGLLEGAYTIRDRINLLIRIVGLQSFDVSDLSGDTARLLREETSEHVARCAIIGESGWASDIASLLSPRIEIETFDSDDEERAWAFVGAVEVAGKA